jgi:hypothetical protein
VLWLKRVAHMKGFFLFFSIKMSLKKSQTTIDQFFDAPKPCRIDEIQESQKECFLRLLAKEKLSHIHIFTTYELERVNKKMKEPISLFEPFLTTLNQERILLYRGSQKWLLNTSKQ